MKLEVLKNGHWENYHPYAALAPGALLSTDLLAELDGMPLGVWQKKDAAYSQLRFLALTPFSWMNPIGGYRPEESGVTAHSTYCVARARQPRCVVWDVPATYASGTDYLRGDVLHRVDGDRMEAVALSNPRLRPVSLAVGPAGQASFQFLEPVVSCRLSMVTTAPSVVVRWQRRKRPAALPDGKERVATVRSGSLRGQWAPPEYEDAVAPVVLAAAALANPVVYDNPAQPIERVVIETPRPDARTVARLAEAIERRTDDWIRSPKERPAIAAEIARLKEQLQAAHDKTCLPHRPVVDNTAAIERLTSDLTRLRTELDKQRVRHRTLCGPTPDPRQKRLPPEECRALAALIAKLEGDAKLIEGRIRELREASEIRFPPGWECGTFVHEVCWLSETDFAYNQTIPQIDAIEADFGTMRAAVEGSIAPIWQPEQTYRITLKVADHVKGPTVDASLADRHYVHFRTGAPLGHFADIPTAGLQPPGPTDVDDGRIEAPERALRYYFDMQRSEPDPSGNLLYAKPVYYRAVILRLLFDKPHAYHFFADWPDGGTYALELAVKDPAEAAPPRADAPAHEAAITVEPTLGEQTWAVDGGVKVAEEFKALRNFQHPQAGRDQKAVCLTSGGDPITPLGKMLETKVGDLRPNKLYTAVVLNRRIDPQAEAVAEVGRFGFMTSRYADFAGHIASFQLTDDDHNERLAVFGIDHDLPGADAAQTLAAARAIVDLVPSTETLAYPDPFDRLCYELLRLEPLPPPSSLECNFVTAPATGVTYAIWLRSLEALFDPRRPATELSGAIELLVGGTVVDTRVLLSRDRSQAFVIAGAGAGALPTEGVSFAFANLGWDGLVGAPVATPVFSRP